MGNNPQTWAIAISLVSLVVAFISLLRTSQYRREQIQLQLPLLDFWTDVDREGDEWVTTLWLQNKGSTAANLIGWSIFVGGKPVDMPERREDWLAILEQVGIDGDGGWCSILSPGFPMQAHQNVKVLEVRSKIESKETKNASRDLTENALRQINIKCQYESPAVDFAEEIYLQDPDTYAEVGKPRV